MAFILTDEQKVTLTLQPTTAKGKIAPVQGIPAWSISNPIVLSLTIAPDGMSAVATSLAVGSGVVSALADADLSAGVSQISGSLAIQVVPAMASFLVLQTGIPVLQ
jgi:hypothetical protein